MKLQRAVRYLAVSALVGVAVIESSAGSVATDVALAADPQVVAGDEFDGPAGGAPNPAMWGHDLGGGGWGNNEQQVYTDSRDNSQLDGQGNLVISAHRSGDGVTSARLVTRGRADFTTGLVEARIKFPAGQGIHPAFWLLGSNIGAVGWPEAGEIDGMEVVNTGTEFHNAVHGPNIIPSPLPWKQSADGPAVGDLSGDFHTYGIKRDPGAITVFLDGNVVGSYTAATMPLGAKWVFDSPMYLVLNVAVGGKWPGPTGATTPFPASMVVDWVRYSR